MKSLVVDRSVDKRTLLESVKAEIEEMGFEITQMDEEKPWGAYYYISEDQQPKFIETFFSDVDFSGSEGMSLSLKFLVVAPEKRLSWQFHHRRQELWRVVRGPVKVMISDSNDQTEPDSYEEGDLVVLKFGMRHRLIGADNWGIVAEIWQHTDSESPSDEEDIVRLQDDFGR